MDDVSATADDRFINERLKKKLNEINSIAQSHLAAVQDHINFTLQRAYFKCAYDCFDRRKNHGEISNCVEHCSVPVLSAQHLLEDEMTEFQETLSRALRNCQDKYGAGKLQPDGNNAMKGLESCVDQCVEDGMKYVPHLAGKLKAYLSLDN